jgi:hypothetical protein
LVLWEQGESPKAIFIPEQGALNFKGRRMTSNNSQKRAEQERKLTSLVLGLIRAHLKGLGRAILKAVRLQWWNQPIPEERDPRTIAPLPTGPYAESRRKERGDLLLFVPRGLNSLIIDDLSGGYGYSHAAVDCGETDLPTGKPVMLESTVGRTVERTFVDTYGERPFVRVRLSADGVPPEPFCECAKSKLGQPYDDLEALTWGQIDDPAKQVCSDLATLCLPEEIQEDIARSSRLRLLRRHAVSVHSRPSTHGVKVFISPNGFAEYFDAPQGEELTGPNQLFIPHKITSSPAHAVGHVVHRNWWMVGAAVGVIAVAGLMFRRSLSAGKVSGGHASPAGNPQIPTSARSEPQPSSPSAGAGRCC